MTVSNANTICSRHTHQPRSPINSTEHEESQHTQGPPPFALLTFGLSAATLDSRLRNLYDHAMRLNARGLERCAEFDEDATLHHVAILRDESGARIIDCGVYVPGGLSAGIVTAEVCLAGMGKVSVLPATGDFPCHFEVAVRTDQPVAACMASQYAGWQLAGEDFYAMGSGPMRAARGREELFNHIGHSEKVEAAIGVLEASRFPPDDVCHHISQECGVQAEHLTLLIAPTTSLAGSIQVVARSIETALHKMHEIGFPLEKILSGAGVAPLPPIANDTIGAIGRTNDAILYGGRVTLWVQGDDSAIHEFGPQIPSFASPDFGQPFAQIFERYDHDFYKIDPLLFSPAEVELVNVESGNAFRFGKVKNDILRKSFANHS